MLTVEQMVESVVKRITTTTLGATALHPEKAAQLIREIEKSTPILGSSRRLNMQSDKRDIDRVGIRSRMMGAPPAEGEPAPETVTPTFSQNQLSVVRAVGVIELTDEALEDNIERENFEDTLIALIGERAGIDLEELYVQGDTISGDPYLALIDGWVKLAGNAVTGVAAPATASEFLNTDVEDMFETMLVSIITNQVQFMRVRNRMAFWVTWKMENDYRELLRERGTSLGDEAQTEARPLAYKGIPIIPVFNLATGTSLFSFSDNLVYGIRRDIRLEAEREAKASRTDFVVTFRTDCHYEDERAVVRASGYVGP